MSTNYPQGILLGVWFLKTKQILNLAQQFAFESTQNTIHNAMNSQA
jgi:hypothetical protein